MKPYLKPDSYNTNIEWYTDLFHSATSSDDSVIVHTYEAAYSGFAASMSPEEVESLRKSESVLKVYPDDKVYNLHTTRTPLFLGLITDDLNELNKASEDVIIGVLDTGVRPESDSFRDDGMPNYVPARWNGTCEFHNDPNTTRSSCNNKLIGARNFVVGGSSSSSSSSSPRDNDGHGSHTASIAAGSEVANVSFSGYAGGNARGVAYRARLAVYKVATGSGAYASDILAGIDAAILDGVDVLSLSLGVQNIPSDYSYDVDPIASGTFAAMERGIFVSCSAGNGGPDEGSVVNVAPWVVTVGAGTIDRDFPAFGILGDGTKFRGASMYVGTNNNISFEFLVYGGDCSSSSSLPYGKVVICDDGGNNTTLAEKVDVVMNKARAKGMILVKSGEVLHSENNFFPMLAVGGEVGARIKRYVASVEHPTVVELRFGVTDVNVKPSPVVAAFSARGPNPVTAHILKPDVIGPGVNVLGAWTDDYFTMIASGTSMSCPHVSGVAALVKAAHPEWGPSAVKSAMMTSAYTLDDTNSSIRDAADDGFSAANPLAYGAGHVNPRKAVSPGLVYEATADDYVDYLCSVGYTAEMIESVTRRRNANCTGKSELDPAGNLNYPSFAVVFETLSTLSYTREVTNVDETDGSTIYEVYVEAPEGVKVDVQPSELSFGKVGDKQRYRITFTSQNDVENYHSFGFITWTNGNNDRQVRSPISVTWR